jgi:hypothetical protein
MDSVGVNFHRLYSSQSGMSMIHNAHRNVRNAYKFLTGKPEKKEQLGRSRGR